MAIESYTAQLERVQTAIATIEAADGGQAVGADGQTLTRADLKTLYDREAWLRRRVAAEERGGGVGVSYVVPE